MQKYLQSIFLMEGLWQLFSVGLFVYSRSHVINNYHFIIKKTIFLKILFIF